MEVPFDREKVAPASDAKMYDTSARKQALRKTKFCLFHLQGVCQYRDTCTFAHSIEEMQGAPDLSRTQMCKQSANGSSKDPGCTFAHTAQELRSVDASRFKRVPCRWYEQGRCRNGAQCRFAHGVDELHVGAIAEKDKQGLPAPPVSAHYTDTNRRGSLKDSRGIGHAATRGGAESRVVTPAFHDGGKIASDVRSATAIHAAVPVAPSFEYADRFEPMYVPPPPTSATGMLPPPPPGLTPMAVVGLPKEVRNDQVFADMSRGNGSGFLVEGLMGLEPTPVEELCREWQMMEADLQMVNKNVEELSTQLPFFRSVVSDCKGQHGSTLDLSALLGA